MSTELSERFLNAFCRLEEELRRITGSGHESFSFLLDHVSRSNPAFAHFKEDLKEFAELRNAIVHKRIGTEAIAEPHPDVVSRIESIADKIIHAELLEDHFHRHVVVCAPQDSLKNVLAQLKSGQFNQAPVYNGNKLIGLLTTEAIAMWLADAFHSADYIDPGTRVRDVLQFAEGAEEFSVLGAKSSIFDALALFEASYKRGKHLKAIIITNSGGHAERPMGIITTLEIPLLITLLNPAPSTPIRKK